MIDVIVAGGDAVQSGAAPALRELADRFNIGVLNTWAAKGLFPWDHPAHLGTIGLQAGDLVLAGLADAEEVVLCGVSNDEIDRAELDDLGVVWRDVLPADIAHIPLIPRDEPTPRPAIYGALAAVCQPFYSDNSLPMNPARAAADLAAWLPPGAVVCGDAGRSGFWLGRTFPTRELGSVQLPTRRAPGFAVNQALTARRTGRFSVAIVDEIDEVSRAIIDRAANQRGDRAVDLVVEVWSDAGPARTADERIAQLDAARASAGIQVLELGLRFNAIDVLVDVAGLPRWGS